MKPTATGIVSPYLNAREVQTYLRLSSDAALYRLVKQHALPYCRRGRLYLFERAAVDAWVHGHQAAVEWARDAPEGRASIRRRA